MLPASVDEVPDHASEVLGESSPGLEVLLDAFASTSVSRVAFEEVSASTVSSGGTVVVSTGSAVTVSSRGTVMLASGVLGDLAAKFLPQLVAGLHDLHTLRAIGTSAFGFPDRLHGSVLGDECEALLVLGVVMFTSGLFVSVSVLASGELTSEFAASTEEGTSVLARDSDVSSSGTNVPCSVVAASSSGTHVLAGNSTVSSKGSKVFASKVVVSVHSVLLGFGVGSSGMLLGVLLSGVLGELAAKFLPQLVAGFHDLHTPRAVGTSAFGLPD